jgi:hypothetical protein
LPTAKDAENIQRTLRRITRVISVDGEPGFDQLYCCPTEQPWVLKPESGVVRALPPIRGEVGTKVPLEKGSQFDLEPARAGRGALWPTPST